MVDHLEIHSLLGYNIPTFYGTHSFNQHVPFLKYLFPHLFLFILFPLKTFYAAPHPTPKVNQPSSSNTPTSLTTASY